MRNLGVLPLTAESFSAYGDVIETHNRPFTSINRGLARRYFGLSTVDVATGQAALSIVQTKARDLSGPLYLMERHPGSTQTFIPLGETRFIIAVSTSDLSPESLRAFITDGRQGVNYRRNVWHHVLVALSDGDFLVVDGGGQSIETEETLITEWQMMLDLPDDLS